MNKKDLEAMSVDELLAVYGRMNRLVKLKPKKEKRVQMVRYYSIPMIRAIKNGLKTSIIKINKVRVTHIMGALFMEVFR